ncbi:MAG TPA: adenylosuccinate lyase, partial [Thermoplasmatales archaeon]|nr:adenylosuccinate lyase [Thermoplasmatales archaeon]
SSGERFTIPHSLILTDWIIFQMNKVFKNLRVFPERMRENIERSKGLPMAESLMMKLVEKGMGRNEAHELLRRVSLKAIESNESLKEVFKEENKKLKLLTEKEIEDALDPMKYLGATEEIIDRAVKKIEKK